MLNYVPFEALPSGKGLVVERFAVSYLPAASVLLRPDKHRGPALPWKTQMAAFGDPIPTELPEIVEAEPNWAALPSSRREIEAISKLLPGHTEAFLGSRDKKKSVSSGLLKQASILHIATHAAIDTEHPDRSRILFSADDQDAESQYMSLGDAQGLNLTNTDLVTLSMCAVEGARTSPGEGLHSFSRAFLAAGAHSAVTTLWQVADEPTSEFMKQFYFYLSKGQSKAASLQQAKLKFVHSNSVLAEPRYWAAFVLYGEGRTPIPPVFSWGRVLLAVAAGLAAVLCLIIYCWGKLRKPPRLHRLKQERDQGALPVIF